MLEAGCGSDDEKNSPPSRGFDAIAMGGLFLCRDVLWIVSSFLISCVVFLMIVPSETTTQGFVRLTTWLIISCLTHIYQMATYLLGARVSSTLVLVVL